jgi:hypothetical protein
VGLKIPFICCSTITTLFSKTREPTFFEDKNIPHSEYLTSMSVGKQTAPLLMKGLTQLAQSD